MKFYPRPTSTILLHTKGLEILWVSVGKGLLESGGPGMAAEKSRAMERKREVTCHRHSPSRTRKPAGNEQLNQPGSVN